MALNDSARPRPSSLWKDGRSPRELRITAILLALAGLVGLAIAAGWSIYNLHFINHSVTVPGTIVDNPLIRSPHGSAYYAKVRFIAPGGQTVEFQTEQGWQNELEIPIGKQVLVYVDPDNRVTPTLVEFRSLWLYPSVAGGFGALTLVVGFATGLKARARRKAEAAGSPASA